MTLVEDAPAKAPDEAGPQQGVIEEARHRRDARRARVFAALLAAMLAGAVAWAYLSGGSDAASSASARHRDPSPAGSRATGARRPFDIRLWPSLSVGWVGWCLAVEEHGRTGGSACGQPFTVQAPLAWGFGYGQVGRPQTEVEYAIVGPNVAAVRVNGHRRIPTVAVPGLPYGLRVLRTEGILSPRLVALDQGGRPLATTHALAPRRAAIRSWHYPQKPANGPCEMHASGFAVTDRGGTSVTAIAPFPERLIGHAFLSCLAVEYELHGEPLRATVLLDAAQPGATPAPLPGFHRVRGQPKIYAGGELTAARSGTSWIVVEQGTDVRQRTLLLEHLSATLRASASADDPGPTYRGPTVGGYQS